MALSNVNVLQKLSIQLWRVSVSIFICVIFLFIRLKNNYGYSKVLQPWKSSGNFTKKGLLNEIKEIIANIRMLDHEHIKQLFQAKGWKSDKDAKLFSDREYDCDAYKEGVKVEIEAFHKMRTRDYFHRVFFSFLAWRDEGKLEVGVLVAGAYETPQFRDGAFSVIIDDIKCFKKNNYSNLCHRAQPYLTLSTSHLGFPIHVQRYPSCTRKPLCAIVTCGNEGT